MRTPLRVVLVTVPDARLAGRIAKSLVREKLAACVSQVPELTSHYFWKGKLQEDREILLIIKTSASAMQRLIRQIRKEHSAQLPEIIALPIEGGEKYYLQWLATQTL